MKDDYLNTYRIPTKLWLEGNPHAAAVAFVKCNGHVRIPGEDEKAHEYASERQKVANEGRAAKRHEAITDAMARGYTTIWQNFPNDGPAPQLSDYPVLVELRDAINERRHEWQKLFGVYHQQKRAKVMAMRLKKFARFMRLVAKNY